MISKKCKTTYAKLNTFVTNVINRDVTPQITNLNETTTSLQETKLDNKEYITTSFTPSKLKTYEYNAEMNKNKVTLLPITNDGNQGGTMEFKFECNANEYYTFNILVESTIPIDLYNIIENEDENDELNLCASLRRGMHAIEISKNQLIIDNTSITNADTYASLRFVYNSTDDYNSCTFSFFDQRWYHEATFFDKIYPIGSVHITTNDVNPSNYFDGEWERIQDTFLLASGTTYSNGSTGGSATVTLTAAQSGVPAHSHKYQDYNTTYTLKTTNRKPGTSTAVAYGTSLTAGGGATERTSSNNTAANASQAHENMPPYLAVYMWKRVG